MPNPLLTDQIISILSKTLNLHHLTTPLNQDSLLLGALPELDSMAVVSIITDIEDKFGFIIHDDEISADNFQSVASLSNFVRNKLDEF